MYGSERTSRSGSANLGGLTQALGAWPCLHSLPHTISEPLLTPRLMSLLDPAAPQAAEVGAVNASLESLQSTLGAAYMLLAAECKAETLEAQVSLARARLAEHVTAEDGLREAYESCVSDFASLRQVVDSARAQAETLASALAHAGTLASLPAEARTACQAKNHEDP